jgi:hypothetical protein
VRGTLKTLRLPILLLIFLLWRDLVCTTGTLHSPFLYLSASAVDPAQKIAHFGIELRKSG